MHLCADCNISHGEVKSITPAVVMLYEFSRCNVIVKLPLCFDCMRERQDDTNPDIAESVDQSGTVQSGVIE